MNRWEFITGSLATAIVGCGGGVALKDDRRAACAYSVPLLGDTHFDGTAPEVYHAAFIRDLGSRGLHPNKAKEHIRNAKMWSGPSRAIVRASARSVRDDATFVLHVGDLVQGDCHDAATHRRMLSDALAYFRSEYPTDLPFVAVAGNHDIRDPEGPSAERVYADFMPRQMAQTLGERTVGTLDGTDFVFRQGPDLYFVFDFNDTKEAKFREPTISHGHFQRQKQLLLANRAERYTFIVVHGGVFPLDKNGDFRWFYLGDVRQNDERREMLRLLAERQAIVLCGHQHVISLKDAVLPAGRITEFTMNTVCYRKGLKENPADPEVVYDDPQAFGSLSSPNDWHQGEVAAIHAEYRPYLKRCYHAHAVGHAVLRVSDAEVAVDYYGHDALSPTRTFKLR